MNPMADITIEGPVVRCSGQWMSPHLHDIERKIGSARWPQGEIRLDLGALEHMDTAGAWLLYRTIGELKSRDGTLQLDGASKQVQTLLGLVGERSAAVTEPPRPYVPGMLESVGEHTLDVLQNYLGFLAFTGNLALTVGQALLRPWRIRGKVVVSELLSAGVNALPIVGLLSFLIGIVIAYQGGVVLRDYGANIYVADIVGLSMVRELAPLITAIIAAGRTGSAYTAQIGTMIVTEEVDALRSIGLAPMEMLVLPKLIALVIALPLLTVFADFLGLLGGMIMSAAMLNLNPITFMARLAEALTLDSYLSGVGKAPVFAAIIATVGCYQGFRVFGSAQSVGRQTTISVVESIFLVIIVDAAFSVAFSKLGI